MEKRLYLSEIYNFYCMLLTDHQRIAFEMYYMDDYSLQEIAELFSITRQAVRDLLKRTENLLTHYEQKLGLSEKYKKSAIYINNIANYLSELKNSGKISSDEIFSIMEMLDKLNNQIYETSQNQLRQSINAV